MVILIGVVTSYTVRLADERDRANEQAERASRYADLLRRMGREQQAVELDTRAGAIRAHRPYL